MIKMSEDYAFEHVRLWGTISVLMSGFSMDPQLINLALRIALGL
jgi:hypothetical protein